MGQDLEEIVACPEMPAAEYREHQFGPVNLADDPHWGEAHKYRDWRNHVPEEIRQQWERLPLAARAAAFQMAAEEAAWEEWD